MVARLALFTLGPGTRSTAEKLVDQFAPALRAQKGFKSVTFLADDAAGEYGTVVLWESKEDAEAALQALNPQLEKALTGIVKGAPTTPLSEVLEPKAWFELPDETSIETCSVLLRNNTISDRTLEIF